MDHPIPVLLVVSMALLAVARIADHTSAIPRAVQQHARLGYSAFMVLAGISGLVLPTDDAPPWLSIVLIVVGVMPTRAFVRSRLDARRHTPE